MPTTNSAPLRATPTPATAVNPSQQVQQFQAQTGFQAGTQRPTVQSATLLPGQRAVESRLQLTQTDRTPTQQVAYGAIDKVKESSVRLKDMYQAKAASRVKAAQASQGGAGGTGVSNVQQGNMANAGRAWTPDGKLSGSRNSLLADASSYLGSRYVLGGTSYKGIDCSGLVMMVYNKLGFGIKAHSATWQGRNIPGVRTNVSNLRPGDIVAWKDGSHIAIYAGNGEIIESANERVGTVRRKIWADPGAVYGIAVRLPGE